MKGGVDMERILEGTEHVRVYDTDVIPLSEILKIKSDQHIFGMTIIWLFLKVMMNMQIWFM